MHKSEILAPAGSFDALVAAVRSGADAVYLGTDSFNARMRADNFSGEKLKEAIDYCHARGVKVHITMNTLVQDSEIPQALEVIKKITYLGADAVMTVQHQGSCRFLQHLYIGTGGNDATFHTLGIVDQPGNTVGTHATAVGIEKVLHEQRRFFHFQTGRNHNFCAEIL